MPDYNDPNYAWLMPEVYDGRDGEDSSGSNRKKINP